MSSKPIGILDSGIGGLTVAKEVIKLLPHESIVYVGDSANTPYGAKTEAEIGERADKLVQFLLNKDVKAIIIACNTITVNCIDTIRKTYPSIPVIGTVPVIKTAAAVSKNKRIGILSTSKTAESAYQKKLIQDFAQDFTVFEHGTDDLVPLIEKGITVGSEVDLVLQNVLDTFKKADIDTLALGCTHYPFIKDSIQMQLGISVQLLEPSTSVARHVKKIIENNKIANTKGESSYSFYTTGDTKVMQHMVDILSLKTASVGIQHTQI